jgi:hypothetical protein
MQTQNTKHAPFFLTHHKRIASVDKQRGGLLQKGTQRFILHR